MFIKFHTLISLLGAFSNACYDYHYNCESYEAHLLAQRLYEGIDDMLDAVKEQIFLAAGLDPLPSKIYSMMTAAATPMVEKVDAFTLRQIRVLAEQISSLANSLKPECRACNVLLDEVCTKMAEAKALTRIQLRGIGGPVEIAVKEDEEAFKVVESLISEAEAVAEKYKKEKCEGCKETPIDRKEVKAAKIDMDKVAKTVLDYEAQNLLLAEEDTENYNEIAKEVYEQSALDRVSKKLGLE